LALTPAEKFWIGLGTYVLAADTILWRRDCDTMSVCFGNWLKTPKGKAACAVGTAGVVIHLFFGMPLPLQRQLKRILGGK
jgi:hypothetical protein